MLQNTVVTFISQLQQFMARCQATQFKPVAFNYKLIVIFCHWKQMKKEEAFSVDNITLQTKQFLFTWIYLWSA